jgi:hypothetical protein
MNMAPDQSASPPLRKVDGDIGRARDLDIYDGK